MIEVEVAYALPEKQRILTVMVEEGSTIAQTVEQSDILTEFPELDLKTAKYDIFGKATRAPQSDTVREGDRVEIYRPLTIDPKKARAGRAEKQKSE